MKRIIYLRLSLFATFLLVFSMASRASLYPFSNTYSGAQENPPNASPAMGTITGVYNDVTNTIFYTLNFSGLMSNTAAAHFHAPAAPGTNAGVIYGYTGFPTGVSTGTYTGSHIITEAQEVLLKNGLWYSNIHTTGLPGGEIRAQIILGAASMSHYTFNNTYSGANENPPNASTGTGLITGVFDPNSNALFYRINFSLLLAPTVAAHFHAPAVPGTNAGVVYAHTGFPLAVQAGTYSGTHTITALQETQLLAGLWYSNIHTSQFPGGEIRAQIVLELAPTLTCPANITKSNDAGSCAASVAFAATATGVPAPSIVYSVNNTPITSPYTFPVGTSTVNAVATNSTGTASCSFTVKINDTEAPMIGNMMASPGQLWPPNNKMRDVMVNYNSTDNCSGMVNCVLTVSSNEPGGADDYTIIDAHHLKLRAKRAGNGDGRIYTITAHCTDASGNSSSSSTTVMVPHDMSDAQSNNITLAENRQDSELSVKVTSNPSTTYFGIDIQSAGNSATISVRLVDVTGKIWEAKNNLRPGQFIKLGERVKPGIYLLQVKQGLQSKQLTLVKQ
jgi:CHRD domain/HYR domain